MNEQAVSVTRAWVSRVLLVALAGAVFTLGLPGTAEADDNGVPPANIDFVDAWTNDDGKVDAGDVSDLDQSNGGPPEVYDAWGLASGADPSEAGVEPPRYDKDVAICTAAVGDPTTIVNVLVDNGYPSYWCTFTAVFTSSSSFPASSIVTQATGVPPELTVQQISSDPEPCRTLGPGQEVTVTYAVHVEQPAPQDSLLEFDIEIVIEGEGQSSEDCTRFEDLSGSFPVFTFNGASFEITQWVDKDTDPGEHVGFYYTVIGGAVDLTIKSGSTEIEENDVPPGDWLWLNPACPTLILPVPAPPGPASADCTPDNTSAISHIDVCLEAQICFPPTPVNRSIDLELGVSCTAGNGQATFQFDLTNKGLDGATGVEVKEVLPDLVLMSSAASPGTTFTPGNTWTVGSLAAGASAALTVVMATDSSTLPTASAQVTKAGEVDVDSIPNNGVATEDDQDTCSLVLGTEVTTTVATETLPQTGSDVGSPIRLGTALVTAGLLLVVGSWAFHRRRRS